MEYVRDEFVEKSSVFIFDRHGSIKLSRDGKPVLEKVVRKKGRPKISWLWEHNLVPSSHLVEWLDAMLSRKQHSYERKKNKEREYLYFLIGKTTQISKMAYATQDTRSTKIGLNSLQKKYEYLLGCMY